MTTLKEAGMKLICLLFGCCKLTPYAQTGPVWKELPYWYQCSRCKKTLSPKLEEGND